MNDPGIAYWIAQLHTGSRDERVQAARRLVDLKDPSTIGSLIRALGDHDAAVRGNAILALVKIGAKAVGPLVKALGDENFAISYHAGQALEEIGRPAAGKLAEALGNKNPDVRMKALDVLVNIGKGTGAPAIEPAIRLLGDENANVRAKAALVLGEIGDERAVRPLIEALGHADANTRFKIVYLLGQMKGKAVDALPALHEAAFKNPELRADVKDAVREIASDVKRPSGVRKVSKKPEDLGMERMFRRMASDVRQQRAAVRF